jgi:quercetin dioxygenase-like cupin family protein
MSPAPVIEQPERGRAFDELGARVWRLVHPRTVGSLQLGVSLCVMKPGERVKRHRHNYEEAYFVTAGTGRMYLEGHAEVELRPGMSVYIAPGRAHGQANDGEDDLIIVCSLSPPPVEGDPPDFVPEDA